MKLIKLKYIEIKLYCFHFGFEILNKFRLASAYLLFFFDYFIKNS